MNLVGLNVLYNAGPYRNEPAVIINWQVAFDRVIPGAAPIALTDHPSRGYYWANPAELTWPDGLNRVFAVKLAPVADYYEAERRRIELNERNREAARIRAAEKREEEAARREKCEADMAIKAHKARVALQRMTDERRKEADMKREIARAANLHASLERARRDREKMAARRYDNWIHERRDLQDKLAITRKGAKREKLLFRLRIVQKHIDEHDGTGVFTPTPRATLEKPEAIQQSALRCPHPSTFRIRLAGKSFGRLQMQEYGPYRYQATF